MTTLPQDKSKATRVAKTTRGRETQQKILAAARELATTKWIHTVPFNALVAEEKIPRSSLLYLYGHWPAVLYDLFREEIALLKGSYNTARALRGARPTHRAYTMLEVMLDRAEQTGLLYPNLRSYMFTWFGQPSEQDLDADPVRPEVLGQYILFDLSDYYWYVEDLLRITPLAAEEAAAPVPNPVGECLLNFTFDLAAGSPSYQGSFDQRRATLRHIISRIAAGHRRRTPAKR